jgi:adenosylcobinamide-phosphate synthase
VELLAGAGLDLLLGDPWWLPHPIRAIGRVISALERPWRASGLPLRLAGAGFWITIVALAAGVVYITLDAAPRPWVHIYWIYSLLAIRDLDVQSARVIAALQSDGVEAARAALAMIVGRDTAMLTEPEIVRAAIETVAENLSDAVVAPLFWLVLGGPVAMVAYKAINTLDSMVGYKNERYREFGWFSARADDIANLVPARITAALIWVCAALLGFRFRDAIRIAFRDAGTQPSPNSGWPEAAAAGALGVQLGGLNYYGGVPSHKHPLGDPLVPLSRGAFRCMRVLHYAVSVLAVVLAAGALA